MVVDSPTLTIEDLPNEIQLQILDLLNYESRCKASEVCRLWNVLAFTGRIMSRIWIRLGITEDNLKLVCATLSSSVRKYRRITVNFNDQPVNMMDQFSQAICEKDALENLTLCGMSRIEPVQFLMLLEGISHLKRLHQLGIRVERSPAWISALSEDSSVSLPHLQKLGLLIPTKMSLPSKAFIRKFPNITQLHLTCNNPSNVALFYEYRNQLDNISIWSAYNSLFITAFASISFPKLSHLYLGWMDLNDQLVVAKCIHFFKNPAHSRTLQQLVLHPRFKMRTPIFSTICANCSALQVLELSLDYMDGDALKDVTNLQQLQKLSLLGTAYFQESPHWPHQIRSLSEVRIRGCRFPISLLEFIADIAPCLNSLIVEDVENPEELFRMLPELVGTIRHLECGYSDGFERRPSCQPSGLLRNMHRLESYHLNRAIIEHGIQGWLQDAPQLRKVTLTDCGTLTDTHLVILTTNCPKLERLQLQRCPEVTARGLEEFRSRIPLCKVDVDVKCTVIEQNTLR